MHGLRGWTILFCLITASAILASCTRADFADGDIVPGESPAASKANHKGIVSNPFPRRIKLPPNVFSGGDGWLNVSGPIELRDLRGKIVVVDFWTYCCINCMHILPDLKYLERKYPNELVVIGVHSAKFNNERDSENIRRAILRYDIEHPVVNDAHMAIWSRLGIRSWPTVGIIDPEGKFVRGFSGEGHRQSLDEMIAKLVAYHRANGTLDTTPLALGLERKKLRPTPLKFPGKVLADEASGRLFISDSNHNRIVICTLAGKLLDVAGTGATGRKNGPFGEATFDHPQGMALHGSRLYVADTENHEIRELNLDTKTVSTLAGTGKQSWGRGPGGALHHTPLSSPWDLAIINRTLFIAMAGDHQIWSHTLGSDSIHAFAGTGREDVINGPRDEAAFAQPSGLAVNGPRLFVADSEGSAIRGVAVAQGGAVVTLAGTSDLDSGRSLFEFGDTDGVGGNARFQHPLGVAFADGRLFVADSYNHKIKLVDVNTGEVRTWLGTGKRGDSLRPAEFAEPGGISAAGGSLYIADTNNHAIKVADLKSREVQTLTIEGLAPPTVPDEAPPEKVEAAAAAPRAAEQRVAAGADLKLEFSFRFPPGYKLNKLAPISCRLKAVGNADLIAAAELARSRDGVIDGEKVVATVPLAAKGGKAELDVALSFVYCRDGVGGLCKQGRQRWLVPVEVAAGAPQQAVQLSAAIRSE